MRVLLVEDEDAIRSALLRALKSWGHEAEAAGSVEEARRLAGSFSPEALVSDLKLPDGSGLDLAGSLGVPFVLMSGFAAFDDAVGALRLGGVDFLTKPVALKTLQAAVGRLADRLSSWDLTLVVPADGGVSLLRPTARGMSTQAVEAQVFAWNSRQQAQEVYERAAGLAPGVRERQLLSELLQAVEGGRLVVNRGPTWWRAWLDSPVAWDRDQENADRRSLIRDLADRVLLRDDGVVVECADGRP